MVLGAGRDLLQLYGRACDNLDALHRSAGWEASEDTQHRADAAQLVESERPARGGSQDCGNPYRKMESARTFVKAMAEGTLVPVLQSLCEIEPPEVTGQGIKESRNRSAL